MHLRNTRGGENTDIIDRIYRWKAAASLVVVGYSLLVYGAISFDEWMKKRRRAKERRNDS